VSCGLAQGIVPDGGTATSVSTATSGKQTVQIAPAAAGVSHNTYMNFNVGRNGADFINTGVNASLILNEVTSTNPSLLQGRIAIIGPRAHFILANPNGITVDGGSFFNTGNLALSTGRVSFNAFDPGDGTTQRNVILTTNGGRIDIGGQGLSGAFNTLELIAKTIRIAGAVNNTATTGRTRLVAGDSRVEFNTTVDGFDGLSSWVQHQGLGTAAPGTLAVDITPLGSLTAGRVEIIVADTGAGVRHAGAGLATFGDFSISSTGEIEIAGGTLTAAGNIVVAASNANIRSRSDGAIARISANGNVDLLAGQASLMSGTVTAGTNGGRSGKIRPNRSAGVANRPGWASAAAGVRAGSASAALEPPKATAPAAPAPTAEMSPRRLRLWFVSGLGGEGMAGTSHRPRRFGGRLRPYWEWSDGSGFFAPLAVVGQAPKGFL